MATPSSRHLRHAETVIPAPTRHPRERPALDLIGGGNPGLRLHSPPTITATKIGHSQTHTRPTGPNPSFPPQPVIPAKAGTQAPVSITHQLGIAMKIPYFDTHSWPTRNRQFPRKACLPISSGAGTQQCLANAIRPVALASGYPLSRESQWAEIGFSWRTFPFYDNEIGGWAVPLARLLMEVKPVGQAVFLSCRSTRVAIALRWFPGNCRYSWMVSSAMSSSVPPPLSVAWGGGRSRRPPFGPAGVQM